MEVPDSVAASVVWRNEKLFGIVATRRGDGAAAALEVPSDRAGDFNSLNLEAIFRNAMMLDRLVQWALLEAKCGKDEWLEHRALRDGAIPAELGSLRCLGRAAFGVDIGEFTLPLRRCLNCDRVLRGGKIYGFPVIGNFED